MTSFARPPTGAAVLALAISGSGAAAQETGPTRVANPGEDRPLSWTLRERFRLGPAMEGPAAFWQPYPWTVKTDSEGSIYVLDVADARVAVFDAEGRHARDLGARGAGPGEFRRPLDVAVAPDGGIVVADAGKGGLVRFASDGTVLEGTTARSSTRPHRVRRWCTSTRPGILPGRRPTAAP